MKTIIPASGKGTRLALFTRFMPKELLPVKGKPAIDWAIEEALEAETEPVVVVSRNKTQLLAYLGSKWGVDIRVEEYPITMERSINFARPKDEPYAVILPDVIAKPFVLEDMVDDWGRHKRELPLVAIAKCPHGVVIPHVFSSEKPFWVVGRYIIEGNFHNIPKGNYYVTESKITTLEEYYEQANSVGF